MISEVNCGNFSIFLLHFPSRFIQNVLISQMNYSTVNNFFDRNFMENYIRIAFVI